jgi:hypothetical protein
MKKDPIAMDAAEVAFFRNFRALPEIMKVEKHTPTQVVASRGRRFKRSDGRMIGANYDGCYIENVEPKHHERLRAAELHDVANEVYEQIWKVQEARFGLKRDALRKVGEGKEGSTVKEVQDAIARLKVYAKEQYGIEVDVPVEKKA